MNNAQAGDDLPELAGPFKALRSGRVSSGVCAQCMKEIGTALRDKRSADDYIREFFRVLTSTENPVQLTDVLRQRLPEKYSKLQYHLRAYTLRALLYDKTAQLTGPELLSIAGEKDIGRLAAIDFILTRVRPTDDQIKALQSLVSTLEDKKVVEMNTKRGIGIEKLQSTLDDNAGLYAIRNHRQLLDNFSKVKRCSPVAIRNWIAQLKTEWNGEVSSDRTRLSTVLVNLGLHFTTSDLSVAIWSLAVEFEDSTAPSKHVFSKVWRLFVALEHFPDADFSAIVHGLELCLKFLKLGPETELIGESDLTHFSGIAAALLKAVRRWPIMVKLLNDRGSHPYTPLVSRLLIQLISYSGELSTTVDKSSKEHIGALMRLSNTHELSPQTYSELEWAYCYLFNEVWDRSHLLSLLNIALEEKLKVKVWTLLAKNDALVPEDAYEWCKKIIESTYRSAETAPLLKELYFLDLDSGKCSEEFVFPDRCETLDLISARKTALIEAAADSVRLMDFYISAWQTLKHEGCHSDALKCLATAFHISYATWGGSSLRTLVCYDMLMKFGKSLDLPASILHENINNLSNIYFEVPRKLMGSFDHCIKMMSSTAICEPLSLFYKSCDFLQIFLQEIAPNLVLMDPVIYYEPNLEKFSRSVREQCNTVFSRALRVDVDCIPWTERLRFARKIRWLRLVSFRFGGSTEIGEGLFQRISGTPMYASRAYHSGVPYITNNKPLNLPPRTICVCLDFEDDGTLTISRYEARGAEPITICIPQVNLTHSGKLSTPLSDALLAIQEIIGQARKKTRDFSNDIRAFWKDQFSHDARLGAACDRAERILLGGFLGLLATVPRLSHNNSALTDEINHLLSEKGILVEPTLVNLMHLAYRHRSSVAPSADFLHELMRSLCPKIDVELINGLRSIFSRYELHGLESEDCRVVLVCDRKSSAIPWESLSVLKNRVVTRALSLLHLQELIDIDAAKGNIAKGSASPTGSASPRSRVTYLVNPDNNLPSTHLEALEKFAVRGWEGRACVRPTEEELVEQIRSASDYIYLGHGAGRHILPGVALRRMHFSPSNAFLFGCSSVAIECPKMDNDTASDYAVKGSPVIMGTLWPVKDRDYTRFTHEFLSRVFDDKQDVAEALENSRSVCVLPWLTGAASVVYGLPW